MVNPMEPLAHSEEEEESRKGLSSSFLFSSEEGLSSGSVSPSHSHNQHRRLRSSTPKDVINPMYVLRDMWFRTLGTRPESDEGDMAHVAKACERACWIAF